MADKPVIPHGIPDGHPDLSPPQPDLDPCERDCGRSGKTMWQSPSGATLTLCAPCSWQHGYGFVEQGWTQTVTLEPA